MPVVPTPPQGLGRSSRRAGYLSCRRLALQQNLEEMIHFHNGVIGSALFSSWLPRPLESL